MQSKVQPNKKLLALIRRMMALVIALATGGQVLIQTVNASDYGGAIQSMLYASGAAGSQVVAGINGEYPPAEAEPFDPEGFAYCADIPLSRDLQRYTYVRCQEEDLEYELVLALMWRESRFQTDAVNINKNGTQDSGIMQINDVNKGWLKEDHSIDDLMDPYQNIDAGIIMLSTFKDKYGIDGALMAYQYGETGMQRKYAQGIYTSQNIQVLNAKRDEFSSLLQDL